MAAIPDGGKRCRWLAVLAVCIVILAALGCGSKQSNQLKADVIFRFGSDRALESWPTPDGSVVSIAQEEGRYVLERRSLRGDLVASNPIEIPQAPARVECVGSLPDGRGFLLCTTKAGPGEDPLMAAQWVTWFDPKTNTPGPWVPLTCWPEDSEAHAVVWEQWRALKQKDVAKGLAESQSIGDFCCVLIGKPENGSKHWHHVIDASGLSAPHQVHEWGEESLFVGGVFTGALRVDGEPVLTGPDRSSWGHTQEKVFLLRVSQEDGKLLWAKEIGPLGFDSDGNFATCLTPRGTVVLVSFYQGPVAFILKDGSRAEVAGGWLAAEVDQNGDFLWAQALAAHCSVWFDRVTVLPDGSLAVRGQIGGGTAEGTMPNRNGEQIEMGNSRFLAVFETPAPRAE